jgi:hypothetical protein
VILCNWSASRQRMGSNEGAAKSHSGTAGAGMAMLVASSFATSYQATKQGVQESCDKRDWRRLKSPIGGAR